MSEQHNHAQHGHDNHHSHGADHHPIQSYKELSAILVILIALTFVTIEASRFDAGLFATWIAVGIATVKSTLVLIYFMHLKFETWLIRGTFLIAIFVLFIIISFTFWDISYR